MRRYETIYILRPNLGEEEISKVIENTNQIILDEKGTIIELNKWGMKKLAYLIKKENLGYYVYCDYAGMPAAVSEIERKFRIDDAVLKYMTIKTAVAISEDQIQQAIGAVSAREIEAQEAEVAGDESAPEEPTKVTEKKDAPEEPTKVTEKKDAPEEPTKVTKKKDAPEEPTKVTKKKDAPEEPTKVTKKKDAPEEPAKVTEKNEAVPAVETETK